MAYKNLTDFINRLEREGELIRVTEEVSAELEITELTDRVSKEYGPALLFEHVKDSKYPVLMNAFGTTKRMSESLLADSLDDIGNRVASYIDFEKLFSLKGIIGYIPKLFALIHCIPIRRLRLGKWYLGRRPACQQVIEKEVDLSKIPVLKCWPEDGGPFVTLPLVFTRYKGSISQNIGMYRIQVLDKNTTGMHWHKHKDGAGIYAEYHKKGERMPVSVAIGADPAITYAATAPLPKGISEIFLAGFLRKKSVRMVKCVTNEIYVPAESEFILEGYVDTSEALFEEGPFGDHTGYYSLVDLYPKFHVTCITHRKNAIYPATIVGKPPMEDCYLAKATERIFLPMLKMIMPELVEINLPLEGVFHNCAIVAIKNSYRGAAQTIMNQIWGSGQMRYTKMIIVVDAKTNPYDIDAVKRCILERVSFPGNLTISKGPLDALDHSSNEALFGNRVGIDATGTAVEAQREAIEPTGNIKIVPLRVPKNSPWEGRALAEEMLACCEDKIILIVDAEEDVTDEATIMWRLFNNIDAGRDFYYKDGRIAVDATKKITEEGIKRPWPHDIVMDEGTKRRVDEIWNSLRGQLKK